MTELCPYCESLMVRRQGPSGVFWGCSKYPTCKGTRQAERDDEELPSEKAYKNDKQRWREE